MCYNKHFLSVISYNVRYTSIRIKLKYETSFGLFHTLTTHYDYDELNQSLLYIYIYIIILILRKCQYLEMLHSFAMVAGRLVEYR